jgi:predicted acetyltransferase
MPALCPPTVEVWASFVAAMAEFQAEGRDGARDYWQGGERWSTPAHFREYVRWLREQALADSPRPPGYVPATMLWWIDGHDYLGRLAIRHRLTPQLREVGGHIGYDVRPSARRRGHATAMLRAALPVARRLGIDPALVTCDVDNVASRRVIERHGGVLGDRGSGKLRFWVPTTP